MAFQLLIEIDAWQRLDIKVKAASPKQVRGVHRTTCNIHHYIFMGHTVISNESGYPINQTNVFQAAGTWTSTIGGRLDINSAINQPNSTSFDTGSSGTSHQQRSTGALKDPCRLEPPSSQPPRPGAVAARKSPQVPRQTPAEAGSC